MDRALLGCKVAEAPSRAAGDRAHTKKKRLGTRPHRQRVTGEPDDPATRRPLPTVWGGRDPPRGGSAPPEAQRSKTGGGGGAEMHDGEKRAVAAGQTRVGRRWRASSKTTRAIARDRCIDLAQPTDCPPLASCPFPPRWTSRRPPGGRHGGWPWRRQRARRCPCGGAAARPRRHDGGGSGLPSRRAAHRPVRRDVGLC